MPSLSTDCFALGETPRAKVRHSDSSADRVMPTLHGVLAAVEQADYGGLQIGRTLASRPRT